MDGPPAPRKRPWELHAITCLFLIAIGAAVWMGTLRPSNSKPEHLIAFAGMTFTLIGWTGTRGRTGTGRPDRPRIRPFGTGRATPT